MLPLIPQPLQQYGAYTLAPQHFISDEACCPLPGSPLLQISMFMATTTTTVTTPAVAPAVPLLHSSIQQDQSLTFTAQIISI